MADTPEQPVPTEAKAAATHDNATSQRHRTPPSSSSSSSSSSVARPSIVNSIASTPDHLSAVATPASPRKRRQTESPEREHRDDSSSSIGSTTSHEKYQRSSQHHQHHHHHHQQSPTAALRPSPIVDPDIAQFPLSLFQSDASDDASGQSASTISNNGNAGGGSGSSNGTAAPSASSASVNAPTHHHQLSPDAVLPREIRPMPVVKRPGKQRAVSPPAYKHLPQGIAEFLGFDIDSSVGSNDGDDELSIDDLTRVLPRKFVEDVCKQLAWDAAFKRADGLPASVLAREPQVVRRYSFFTQLRGYQNCRLVDMCWSDVFEAEPVIVEAFQEVMQKPLPRSRGHWPLELIQDTLRSLCFACLLNDMDGDYRGRDQDFMLLCTSRFGMVNLCHYHCQTWAAAAKSENGSYLICDLCLMEGFRADGRRSHHSGNILTNEDLSVGDSTWNTCESCRIDNFYDQWSHFPVTVPHKYRKGLKSTKAYTLFTAHGRGGAANAVADAHEELEQLAERQKERCDCSICKRMKRQRKEEVKGLEGAAKRREEAAAATAAAAIAAAAIRAHVEQRGNAR